MDPKQRLKLDRPCPVCGHEGLPMIHVNYFCRLCANCFCRSDSLST